MTSNYNKTPSIQVVEGEIWTGWKNIVDTLIQKKKGFKKKKLFW
jgi:hypothetical protein